MSLLSSISGFFKKVVGLISKALTAAVGAGLSDLIVSKALAYVKQAANKFADNAEKREWVIQQLMRAKVPESIARLAVELAYQLYREELAKLEPDVIS